MRRHEGISPYPHMPDVRADGEENPPDWLREVVTRFERSISDLTSLIEDRSHRVDEYQVQGLNATSLTTLQVSPDYDLFDEVIESVVVQGPTTPSPATVGPAFTLKLGRRVWSLLLPPTGILVIGPLHINLDRNSDRYITSAVAGDWSLELMGYADVRYRYK